MTEQEEVIAWLRSPEGEHWSSRRLHKVGHQPGRSGVFGSILPGDHPYPCALDGWNECGTKLYRPWNDKLMELITKTGKWIYEPESVTGLSSPA